tara:strand:- start:14 stop:544 length:531 start_codon:yes stop_codon:yes gene_type:complete
MINYFIENKTLIFISIIIICLTVIYNQYNTIQDKNEEIYLLENITEEFNVSLQNIDNEISNNENNQNNNESFANKTFKKCPECEKCDEKKWDGPPCPDCKECPQFYNDRVIYKNLITKYKIEFPDYEMLSNDEKDILHQIFISNIPLPEPNIENEYFPYNILDNKIDMENVMPSMA